MIAKELAAGTMLLQSGQKLDKLYLIMKGSTEVTYPGGRYVLRVGDIVGLCEAGYEAAFMNYKALDKLAVILYEYQTGHVEKLFEGNVEPVKYFTSSLFRQLNEVLSQYKLLKVESVSMYGYVTSSYEDYNRLCEKHHISPKELPEYEDIEELVLEDDVQTWIGGYYATLEQMLTIWDHNKTDYEFVCGFLMKASQDIHDIVVLCNSMQDFKTDMCQYLLNPNGLDLFDLYSSLYFKVGLKEGLEHEDVMSLRMNINDIIMQLENQDFDTYEFFKNRVKEFENKEKGLIAKASEEVSDKPKDDISAELKDSLEIILAYGGCEEETAKAFRSSIAEYRKTVNKNSTEEEAAKQRSSITALFYKVYIAAFQASVKEEQIPRVLWMFFCFGYVDAEIAGEENTRYMYSIAEDLQTSPEKGIYSLYEWMLAIYEGKKEPSRNEFDMEYMEYLHEQKRMGKISQQEETRLLKDNLGKVKFELENMFPLVNKMTFGRISTFCPVFSEHNVLKPLETIMITASKVEKVFHSVKKLDFSAYYREIIYSEPSKGVPKEFLDIEVVPDVILMPNAGIRGVLWQEIESKKRTTSARMMCSIFQMEDLAMILIRLTGEFRWEMCRRIQGARWNDVSERSLTSEYFDYLQFYRKNLDLSPDAKDKIKSDMIKAKNSYKEMFIRDYIVWILYESNASPRLNKVARNILLNHCPFTASVREKLRSNPMYKEILDKYDIRMGQKKHHFDNVCQKLSSSGKGIPDEIMAQKEYLEL